MLVSENVTSPSAVKRWLTIPPIPSFAIDRTPLAIGRTFGAPRVFQAVTVACSSPFRGSSSARSRTSSPSVVKHWILVILGRSPQERSSRPESASWDLLNAAAWLNGRVSPEDPVDALRRLARMRGNPVHDAITLARGAPRMAEAVVRLAHGRSPVRRMVELDLECIVEVSPDPDSRITLSNRRDALGMPLSRVDWRVGEREVKTLRAMAHAFMREAARLGLPVPEPTEEISDGVVPASFLDVAHPTGATRMSFDPATGVVDTDCAVFGIRGLFIGGSSVFPTSGHANPTQTAVALAIRLAHHISSNKSGTSRRRTQSFAVPAAIS